MLYHQMDGVDVPELNVYPDYVHVLLTIPPIYSISKMMGFPKGQLSMAAVR